MPACQQCGWHNKIGNNYCVKCGAEIRLTPEMAAAKAAKSEAENKQKALYLLLFFLVFAVIDITTLYQFPALLIVGLFADGAITALLYYGWLGPREQSSFLCRYCGRKLVQDEKFCNACGKAQAAASQPISKTETTASGKPHRMKMPYFIGYFAICFLVMALVTMFLPSGLMAPHWYEILVLQILLAIAVAAVATLRRKP